MRPWLPALAMLLPLACGAEEELAIFAGQSRVAHGEPGSPGWSVAYSHDITPHVYGGVVHLNEGHFPGHHRDGIAAQLGVKAALGETGITLRGAVGPYNYFDTAVAENGDGFADAHGTGVLYTLAAQWRRERDDPWSWQLRMDRVHAPHGLDSNLFMLGASYRVRQDATFPRGQGASRGDAPRDEIVVSAGQTIVNSFESQNSIARSIDYRHAFTPVVRGTVSWINEGDARLIRRNGVVAQAWLEPTFYDGRFSLGVGLGPYVAIDHYRGGEPDLLGLLSMGFSARLSRSWNLRITWHRSVSGHDRDTDIILAGVGYRF